MNFTLVKLLIGGGLILLFVASGIKRLRKLRIFRAQWLSIKAKGLAPDDAWRREWRELMLGGGAFVGGWLAIIGFVASVYAMCGGTKAGVGGGLFVLVSFYPIVLIVGGIAGALGFAFGALFASLWVKISPAVASLAASAPFIVIALVRMIR